jgi:hypothetical protein
VARRGNPGFDRSTCAMTALAIPGTLKDEFATVEAIWGLTHASTRGVDALILTWVKYEKQTRRLFSFLVQQHFGQDSAAQAAVQAAILANRKLNPKSHLEGIVRMAGGTEADLIGPSHAQLSPEIERIHGNRNKILHGQLTGHKLDAARLEADVVHVIAWMAALAATGTREFGYDGLERNTARLARIRPRCINPYPFTTAADFDTWLSALTTPRGQRPTRPQAGPGP